jgi:RHS repeat-associated protein
MTAVVKGTRRSEFQYDGGGRRVRITEKENAVVVSDSRYVWDGTGIVEERDARDNSLLKRFSGAGEEVFTGSGSSAKYFYATDHLGSVREVTDGSGALTAAYDYDPYGRGRQTLGTFRATFGYASYFAHQASKLWLTVFRAYDPNRGRWLSRDPIGEAGGLNLYGYVGNNPINFTDPSGLYAVAFAPLAGLGPVGWAAIGIGVLAIGLIAWYAADRSGPNFCSTPRPQAQSPQCPTPRPTPQQVGPTTLPPGLSEPDDGEPEKLYAFGSGPNGPNPAPRPPRPGKDLPVDEDGNVGPEYPPRPNGASTTSDPYRTSLVGHYYSIPKNYPLPEGLAVIADGIEVGGERGFGHHTIYPTQKMSMDQFTRLYLGLPWKYEGNKRK